MNRLAGVLVSMAAALVFTGCAVAPAPAPDTKPTRPNGDWQAFRGKAVVSRTHTAADGSQETITYETAYARDSHGRVRMESVIPGETAVDDNGDSLPMTEVLIDDPVSGSEWTLYPQSGRAVRHDGSNALLLRQWDQPPPMIFGGRSMASSLGSRTIAGVSAQGIRTEFTDASGAAIETVERWTSPRQLQGIALEDAETKPDGTVVYSFQVTELKLEEPPLALFSPPADYQVKNMSPNRDAAIALFRQARSATQGLPDFVAAEEDAFIASSELQAMAQDTEWQVEARRDAGDVFHEVVALMLPAPAAPAPGRGGTAPTATKLRLEQQLVRDLLLGRPGLTHDDYAQVLQLIRSADVTKAPLYDAFLQTIATSRSSATEGFDPVALVQECQQADNSFPYAGVLAFARPGVGFASPAGLIAISGLGAAIISGGDSAPPAVDTGTVGEMLGLGFTAVGAEKDPDQLPQASDFLVSTSPGQPAAARGRGGFPFADYRNGWEAAVRDFLNNHPPLAYAPSRRLLAQLNLVDPDAAAAFGIADLQNLGAVAAQNQANQAQISRAIQQNPLILMRNDPAAALAAAAAQSGPVGVQQLVQMANLGLATDPVTAHDAAVAAASRLDNGGNVNANQYSQLASAMLQLGMADQAESLLDQALDRAIAEADGLQTTFDQLPPDQQATYSINQATTISAAFATAARQDFPLAAERSGQVKSSLVAPLVLAAIAQSTR